MWGRKWVVWMALALGLPVLGYGWYNCVVNWYYNNRQQRCQSVKKMAVARQLPYRHAIVWQWQRRPDSFLIPAAPPLKFFRSHIRLSQLSVNKTGTGAIQRLQLKVENTNNFPIPELEVAVIFYNRAGKEVRRQHLPMRDLAGRSSSPLSVPVSEKTYAVRFEIGYIYLPRHRPSMKSA